MIGLRTRLRAYLGTDTLTRIEATMADMLTLLNGLAQQTTEASAAQQASFLNIHNALTRQGQQITDLQQQLADAVANSGQVTPEMQAKADEIAQSLADIRKGAETADDGFEPVEVPTDPNLPNGPDDGGGDVPVVTDPVDGTPVDETPTVAVEDAPVDNARKR